MGVVVVEEEWSQVGSQRTPVVVVGVAIEAVVQLKEGFARADQLSSLPVKAFPFQATAYQGQALWLFVAWIEGVVLVVAVGVVEWGREQGRKRCFPHSQMTRSHCWSLFLLRVHPQRQKLQTGEKLAVFVVAAAAVDEAGVSQEEVFGISPVLHPSLLLPCLATP